MEAFARKVNPLLKDTLSGMSRYCWVMDQAEYATDIMFKDSALTPLYEVLLRHATLCFSAEDVGRLLKRLQMHGLISKVPRSRRWRVTSKGRSLMIATLKFHGEEFAELIRQYNVAA